jgi:hypothetical protein
MDHTEVVIFPAGTLEMLQRVAPHVILPSGASVGAASEFLARINAGTLSPEDKTEDE